MKKAQKIAKTIESMTKVMDIFDNLNAVVTGNNEVSAVITFYDHNRSKLFSTNIKNIKKLDSNDELVGIFKFMIPEFPEIRRILQLSVIARRNILAICKRAHMADLSKTRYIAISTVKTVDYDCRYVYGYSICVHTGKIMCINNTVNVDNGYTYDYSACADDSKRSSLILKNEFQLKRALITDGKKNYCAYQEANVIPKEKELV